jgi:hypothetical protein
MRRTRKRAAAGIVPVLVVASLLSVVTAASSPASSDEGVDLSSDAAIVRYLQSIGVDLADVVWQRGLRNYAGPSCPGPGWNCVPANRPVVQITTPLGANQYHCTGRECVAVQAERDDDEDDDDGDDEDNGDKNVATCEVNSSGSSNILQVCILGQESTGHTANTASIKMSIAQGSGSRNSTLTARQVARITQTNTAGKNVASISQSITQSQNASYGMTISQTEEARQAATVDQDTTSGANLSNIAQWQNQSQRAERATVSIAQKQNTVTGNDFFCDGSGHPFAFTPAYDQEKNQCVEVEQDSSVLPGMGGHIDSDLSQKIKESQTASKSPSVNQQQGNACTCLGQSGAVFQNSSAPDDSDALQETVQTQWATAAPTLTQFKTTGDPRCCATQTTNSGSTADITQRTIQSASSDDATQSAQFIGSCESTGSCHVFQSSTIDGDTDTNECSNGPPGFCNEVIICTEVPVGENGGTQTECAGDETGF